MTHPQDSGKSIEIQKLKALELEKKINELENKKSGLEAEIREFKGVFRRIEDIMVDIEKLSEKKEGEQIEDEGKILIDKNDFDELLDISKRQHILENRLKRIEKENETLKSDLNNALETVKLKDEELENKRRLERELLTAQTMLKKADNQFRMISDYLKSINQFGNAREFMLQREQSKKKEK